MESIIVQTVPEHLCVDAGATRSRVFEFLEDEGSAAFAHDKTITQQVEWTTSQGWIVRPPAHGLDDVECADGNGREWCFCPAGDDHIRKIVSNVTECFAHGYGATGTAV